MSETLYVEGPDPDVLLERIREEYGAAACVISQKPVRRGGMFGFFSRELVGITYQVAVEDLPVVPADDGFALSDLLDRADSSDGPPAASIADPDFAQVLAALTGLPASPAEPPVVLPAPELPAPPVRDEDRTPPYVAHRPSVPARPKQSARAVAAHTRLGMLAELREVGVPVPMTPEAGETSLYRAIEQVIDQLPAAPPPPSRAGEILILAGPLDVARVIARDLARQLHIPVRAVWIAGHAVTSKQAIYGPQTAAQRAAEMRSADIPSLVVVSTDGSDAFADDRPSWAAQVIAALQPDAVWAVVDATRKAEDSRSDLEGLGPIDALALHSAARTASPATVWDLDIPVALLDGRPASAGVWAALLFDRLRAPDGSPRSRGD